MKLRMFYLILLSIILPFIAFASIYFDSRMILGLSVVGLVFIALKFSFLLTVLVLFSYFGIWFLLLYIGASYFMSRLALGLFPLVLLGPYIAFGVLLIASLRLLIRWLKKQRGDS